LHLGKIKLLISKYKKIERCPLCDKFKKNHCNNCHQYNFILPDSQACIDCFDKTNKNPEEFINLYKSKCLICGVIIDKNQVNNNLGYCTKCFPYKWCGHCKSKMKFSASQVFEKCKNCLIDIINCSNCRQTIHIRINEIEGQFPEIYNVLNYLVEKENNEVIIERNKIRKLIRFL